MIKPPKSMLDDLGKWNHGKGIDLESWVGCEGSFSLAVGYTTVFWPDFVVFDDYILRDGFSEESLRGFERQTGGNRRAVETVMNHLHIGEIHHHDCDDISRDKILLLGDTLREIYEAKLQYLFPDSPCTVSLATPDDQDDFYGYEITFWQTKHT